MHLNREIKVKFDARPKLPKDIGEEFDKLFTSKRPATEDAKSDKSKKSKTKAKATKHFGWGAIDVD